MLGKKGYVEPDFVYQDFSNSVLLGSGMWSDHLTNDFGQDDFYGGLGGENNG